MDFECILFWQSEVKGFALCSPDTAWPHYLCLSILGRAAWHRLCYRSCEGFPIGRTTKPRKRSDKPSCEPYIIELKLLGMSLRVKKLFCR